MINSDQDTDISSAWLIEYADAIDHLRKTNPDLEELLADYLALNEAIQYWTSRSRERVREFRCLAGELEREILGIVFARVIQVGPGARRH